MKKLLALLLVLVMVLSLAACGPTPDPNHSTDPTTEPTTSPSTEPTTVPTEPEVNYPITPEELGSGDVMWSEETTADGWIKVINEGGETLGYSADSGVCLIQVEGYAFKDLNRNGALDKYEDWRLDDNTRAADLASQISNEQIFGLMVHFSVLSLVDDGADAVNPISGTMLTEMMETGGIRSVLSFATSFPARTQATWNNNAQAAAEALDFGIPVNISSNPRSFSGAGNMGLAATFDAEYVAEVSELQARQYRAVGVTTLLGPQIDLATDPRGRRFGSSFGEDPALSRDMTNAVISALQSTYAENGTDLGWGADSVNAMVKHYPGDGTGEGGREAHGAHGAYSVYPGDAFDTHLINFFDGAMNLDSVTGMSAAAMPSYSISYSESEEYGELVGSSFSEFKIGLLRNNGYDGLICTDWDVSGAEGAYGYTPWGVEDLTREERVYKAIKAGVDQFGNTTNTEHEAVAAAYGMWVDEFGEESARERFENSARRVLVNYFQVGLFENPYVDVTKAVELLEGTEAQAVAYESLLKSVVMLKNSNNTIKASVDGEKPTVYIPMQYSNGTWSLPVDQKAADAYYNVITDTVGEPTGDPDRNGNPTYAATDIIRASADELASCDYAIVFVSNPSTGSGYDSTAGEYIPISLQYGEYVANSQYVRGTSIAGAQIMKEVESPYGMITTVEQENRSYYGKSTVASNLTDLEGILYAAANMPETAKVIVCANISNPMIFNEFEDKVDAILVGFDINSNVFLDITSGTAEPAGLLPFQMPANMDTVEAQYEDVPRDMECHVDTDGNAYDFAFGMNWSGVINDERVAAYDVEPLTDFENPNFQYAD